jgi:DNA-binding NtrC family response regulator/tRNA A-37 threonylcarbamoyl transferase component Bud32
MRVFISHSSFDNDFAMRLCNDLILYEIEVWYDEWCIKPGESIPQAIQVELQSCSHVLLLLSQPAVASNWVQEEANSILFAAISSGHPKVIPLLLQKECPLPAFLRHRKHLDFTNPEEYEASLTKLIEVIFADIPGSPSRLPVIPGFREIRFLGEGGFSTVYKATDARTLAIKAIKVPKGKRRLEPEAEIVAQLAGHNGVVPVERTLAFNDRTLLVMPYAGHSLKWHIEQKRVGPAQLEFALGLMKQLAHVLAHAHERGVVHRDIKPANILIDDFGILRVVDFGIAQKIQYAEFQQSTIVRGTLCYMSPEQQLARPSGPPSDIYSFGAVFFEVLTGEKPVGRFLNPRRYNSRISVVLERLIERCLERDPIRRYTSGSELLEDLESVNPLETLESVHDEAPIIGRSKATEQLRQRIELTGRLQVPTLVIGESGVGKDLVARALHQVHVAHHGDGPLVFVNMAAISETFAESQLFGHVSGAFSGAENDRPGLFAEADGGTLVLDEIGDTSIGVQARLLRVLETGTFSPVGSAKPLKVSVRVIAITNRDLRELVRTGVFREDLYFRIAGHVIDVPPLRDRVDDIPMLVEYFLARLRKEHDRECTLTPDALARLQANVWPGNVRQLRSVLEIAVAMSSGTVIRSEDLRLPRYEPAPESGDKVMTLADARAAAERDAILAALSRAEGNRSKAAALLDVSRGTLRSLLKKYGIES